MKIVINDASKIEKLIVMFRVLKQFTSTIMVHCDEEKMYIQAMDPAKISIAEYTLQSGWFDEYSVDDETDFGVSTRILCSVFGCYIDNGSLTMEINDEGDKLHISYASNDDKAIITYKNYNVPLIDIDEELLNIPESEYEADLGMSTTMFNDMVSEISAFSAGIHFNISEEHIKFTTTDSYANEDAIDCDCEINVDIENVEEFSIDEDCEINVSFTTKYISIISSFSKIFENIGLSISGTLPLKIFFADEGNYDIKFYFAPKIEDN